MLTQRRRRRVMNALGYQISTAVTLYIGNQTHTHTNKKDHPFLAFFVCPSYTHSNINPIRAAHGSATVSKSADERRQMAELY